MENQISRLLARKDPVLHEGRLALLSNQTSYDPQTGLYLFELLHRRGVLKRLFLPEHGLFAELQDQVPLTATEIYRYLEIDAEVVSLYGDSESSLVAPVEKLRDLDALVVDIQDVGSRYYTFATTLSYIFDLLKEHRLPLAVYVVDRPNPAGRFVEGTILPETYASFVGRPGLPHRHGLTMGELSLFYRDSIQGEFPLTIISMEPTFETTRPAHGMAGRKSGVGVQPHIHNRFGVSLEGFSPAPLFVDPVGCRSPWNIPPSPNMPAILTPLLYSGQCLLEGTELSEGRGTTRPFEIFGAPYLNWSGREERDHSPLLERGARLRPLRFIPTFHKYAGEPCTGYQIILSGHVYHSLGHSLKILRYLREKHPDQFGWRDGAYEFRSDRPAIELLAGDPLLLDYLHGRDSFFHVRQKMEEEERGWIGRAGRFLLYGDRLRRAGLDAEFDYA